VSITRAWPSWGDAAGFAMGYRCPECFAWNRERDDRDCWQCGSILAGELQALRVGSPYHSALGDAEFHGEPLAAWVSHFDVESHAARARMEARRARQDALLDDRQDNLAYARWKGRRPS
jgi:hypothetical protein